LIAKYLGNSIRNDSVKKIGSGKKVPASCKRSYLIFLMAMVVTGAGHNGVLVNREPEHGLQATLADKINSLFDP
jgi:hypothetical protein